MNATVCPAAAVMSAAIGVSLAQADITGGFPLSLFFWCLCGSFCGVAAAGPAKVREALSRIQGRAAVIVEVAALGVGGLASLVATALLGYALIGAIHMAGTYQVPLLTWAGKVKPADLWPLGIIGSAVMQFGAQRLLATGVEVAVDLLEMIPRKRRKDDDE